MSVEREIVNPAHRVLSPTVNHLHKVLREKDGERELLSVQREEKRLIRQFLQMVPEHTTLNSRKDSICYNK